MTGRDRAVAAAARMSAALAEWSVQVDPLAVFDRFDALALGPAGQISPNGSCRLIQAADGEWFAANLPRADDADLVAAWTGAPLGDQAWPAVLAAARTRSAHDLVATGAELGLAVALLGEAAPGRALTGDALGEPADNPAPRRVLDLSTLWAGPLCAGLLAAAGHDVFKVESTTRPDPVAQSTPALHARLNGQKRCRAIPFDRAHLAPLLAKADVVVTSARPRAFAALGLTPEALAAARPGLIWIAVTGHGWHGAAGQRIGFGDDAAVAGGLVEWEAGTPRFAGDALADPLTGLAAALAALQAIDRGGGVLIDAALSAIAARVAAGGEAVA